MATNKYSKVQAPKQVKGYTVNAIVDDVPMACCDSLEEQAKREVSKQGQHKCSMMQTKYDK